MVLRHRLLSSAMHLPKYVHASTASIQVVFCIPPLPLQVVPLFACKHSQNGIVHDITVQPHSVTFYPPFRLLQNRTCTHVMALTVNGTQYPEGSLLMDCPTIPFADIEALAQRRATWNTMVNRLP